ncbi:MAG: nickel pincer cofactor biosynthesis protein LarC [Actinomycetota bacterium]|nr:nickel pincer cofactor biosynthesis protein LarC [Actinomycetota bacterium]
MSRRVAWFNCSFAGIAGDMALGSLVDAGADVAELMGLLERLPIGGWSLDFEPCMRNGLAATRAVVGTHGDGVIRTFMHVTAVIEEARLPERVRDRALGAFSALATAEGRLHRKAPGEVQFHEVGGHDSIVDIVGSASALEVLGIDVVASSAVATGSGVIRSAHGLLPNPSPAVCELLGGIPVVGRDLTEELTTPTGAAILRAWSSSYGRIPDMRVESSGFGAGLRQLDGVPNCTQVVTGELGASASPGMVSGQPLVELETNLDDATGETLASALTTLVEAGALDAWVTPIVMKKGRPAHTVSVLCEPVLAGDLMVLLHRLTGTLGVRAHGVDRWTAPRRLDYVEVLGQRIRMKLSPGRVKAEHRDVERAAAATGSPIIEIAARAEAAWREAKGTAAGPPAGSLSPVPPPA